MILILDADNQVTQEIAERLRQYIQDTNSPTGQPITISLGIASFPTHGETAPEIISAADKALYISKTNGRNRSTII